MTLAWKTMHQIKKDGIDPVPIWPPRAGHYQWLNADETRSAILIWYGPPLDPETGEELDRSPRWQALRDGAEIQVEEVWPLVRGREITESEYDELRSMS